MVCQYFNKWLRALLASCYSVKEICCKTNFSQFTTRVQKHICSWFFKLFCSIFCCVCLCRVSWNWRLLSCVSLSDLLSDKDVAAAAQTYQLRYIFHIFLWLLTVNHCWPISGRFVTNLLYNISVIYVYLVLLYQCLCIYVVFMLSSLRCTNCFYVML